MPLTTSGESRPEDVRTFLQLTSLLDGIQHDHPEVSAPLRLTLFRARRDGLLGSLDESRFRALVAEACLARPTSTGVQAPSKNVHRGSASGLGIGKKDDIKRK